MAIVNQNVRDERKTVLPSSMGPPNPRGAFVTIHEWHHWDFERIFPCMETELFENYSNK